MLGRYIAVPLSAIKQNWLTHIRAMLHNEDDYPDPMAFHPERFLKEGKLDASVRDPSQIAFGFGRRYVGAVALFPGQRLSCIHWHSKDMPGSTYWDFGLVVDCSKRSLRIQHQRGAGQGRHAD